MPLFSDHFSRCLISYMVSCNHFSSEFTEIRCSEKVQRWWIRGTDFLPSFFYAVALKWLLLCNGAVLKYFWSFWELLKCIPCTKIYFIRNIFTCIRLMFGHAFRALEPVYQSPKCSGHSPGYIWSFATEWSLNLHKILES